MAEAEGRKFEFKDESEIQSSLLETFEFDSPNQLIITQYPEFSAVCPFSGLPDVAELEIRYRPTGGKCIELKSLKYYLVSFRNVGLYQEGCTKRIREDLERALGCPVQVGTVYNTRGGFDTTCIEGSVE